MGGSFHGELLNNQMVDCRCSTNHYYVSMGSCYFHLVFASFWVSLHISSRFNVGWEPSMQDDAQGLRPGADACVEQVWNGGGTWWDVPGIPGILWRVWWSSEFTMGYGEMFFLNVFLDCMFLTRMFMVIVFGACHVLKKTRQRHHNDPADLHGPARNDPAITAISIHFDWPLETWAFAEDTRNYHRRLSLWKRKRRNAASQRTGAWMQTPKSKWSCSVRRVAKWFSWKPEGTLLNCCLPSWMHLCHVLFPTPVAKVCRMIFIHSWTWRNPCRTWDLNLLRLEKMVLRSYQRPAPQRSWGTGPKKRRKLHQIPRSTRLCLTMAEFSHRRTILLGHWGHSSWRTTANSWWPTPWRFWSLPQLQPLTWWRIMSRISAASRPQLRLWLPKFCGSWSCAACWDPKQCSRASSRMAWSLTMIGGRLIHQTRGREPGKAKWCCFKNAPN